MFDLQPPRHISTLRISHVPVGPGERPFTEPTTAVRCRQRDRRATSFSSPSRDRAGIPSFYYKINLRQHEWPRPAMTRLGLSAVGKFGASKVDRGKRVLFGPVILGMLPLRFVASLRQQMH